MDKRIMNTDEHDLVRRMVAGDEEAFDEFSDTYLPALYRFVGNRLGRNRELTREIVQTSACKVIAKLGTFRGEAALLTWMATICRNEIAMHFRRQSHRPWEIEWTPHTEDLSVGIEPDSNPDAEQTLIRDERANFVHMILDLLPPHYGRALEWKYIDNLSVKEIAVRLEVGVKAAESLLSRARRSFRTQYDLHLREMEVGDHRVTVGNRRAVSES